MESSRSPWTYIRSRDQPLRDWSPLCFLDPFPQRNETSLLARLEQRIVPVVLAAVTQARTSAFSASPLRVMPVFSCGGHDVPTYHTEPELDSWIAGRPWVLGPEGRHVMRGKRWRDAGFLAFDLETWGLNPEKHRIAEFGGVWVRGDGEVEAYLSEVYHWGDGAVDDRTVAVHGITRAKVAGRPTFLEDLPTIMGFAQEAIDAGAIPLAFNAPFDVGFIAHAVKQARGDYNPFDLNRCIDPLVWCRWRWQQGNKLTDATARLGVLVSQAHRAGDDALAAARVFLRLADHPDFAEEIPETIEALLERQWFHVRTWEKRTGRRYIQR